MVELWTDNSLPSATLGSNLRPVWCINCSEEETLCSNSHSRVPGLRVYHICYGFPYEKTFVSRAGVVVVVVVLAVVVECRWW